MKATLEVYYEQVHRVILSKQHPITGLLPASTAVNLHGDYRDAWVRDNVYSILAVWGLASAYRRLDDDDGRQYELEQAVIKLMRGLLVAMMKQADKVEAFKQSQHPKDALHAKFSIHSAEPVVADDAWGHLQLDATSLYLLMLAQMTTSGLTIIQSLDEVNFVQNLVYYIARAYRTPDYGIWERGDKTNHGEPELNASSIALAKAALESLSGFDLFGARGSQASVIHVLPDEIARASITLESLLPRESSSKEVDAALLSAISFPAFAVSDDLASHTRATIIEKLSGRYGLKRFLRDGHQTVIEDPERLHYQAEELKQFEHIECEWPLFFCYLALDGFFRNDRQSAEAYLDKLSRLTVVKDGLNLLPELYIVPQAALEQERLQPGSQKRLPNDNLPLVWAQSLYLLAQLLADGLISVHELDPLGRHRPLRIQQPVVQVVLVAEDEAVQQELASLGIQSQTTAELSPVQLVSAADLTRAYTQVGCNAKLQLSGRPLRRLLSLSTSRIFQVRRQTVICPPTFLDKENFYLSLDPRFLITRLRSELAYIQRNWQALGRPTLTLLISHELLKADRDAIIELLYALRSGTCGDVPVRLMPVQFAMQRSAQERIDEVYDFEFSQTGAQRTSEQRLHFALDACRELSPDEQLSLELETSPDVLWAGLSDSRNLYEQVEILERLLSLPSEKAHAELYQHLEELYSHAAATQLWAVLRRAASLLNKVDIGISEAVTDILVSQKTIVLGKSYSEGSLINRPLPQQDLLKKIDRYCRDDVRDRVLTQEMLVYLGLLIRAEPELFKGMLTVRIGYLILLIAADLAQELGLSQDEGYACLMHLPPSDIETLLRDTLKRFAEKQQVLSAQESIRARGFQDAGHWQRPTLEVSEESINWWDWRRREGVVTRLSKDFYAQVWYLLEHAQGIIIGDKLERRNRLESHLLLSETTAGERNFAMRVEHLLNKIASPEYRQLTIEALSVLSELSEQQSMLFIEDYLVLDVIIGHAVRLAFAETAPERAAQYEANKAAAWAAFYNLPPQDSQAYVLKAFEFLLQQDQDDVAA